MMKYALAILLLLLGAYVPAQAQAIVRPCVMQANNLDCLPVSGTNPLPTTGGAISTTGLDPSKSVAGVEATCGSAVSSCVLKAAAGKFYGVYANCTAACWLMVFNAISAPSNGSTTAGPGTVAANMTDCIPIAAGGANSVTYPVYPKNMTTGITAAISSTACATLTLSAVGFISAIVE